MRTMENELNKELERCKNVHYFYNNYVKHSDFPDISMEQFDDFAMKFGEFKNRFRHRFKVKNFFFSNKQLNKLPDWFKIKKNEQRN